MKKGRKMDIAFNDLTVEHGLNRVTWEWIGEGLSGDYNEKDKEDVPLLRFSCDKYDIDTGIWNPLDDSSYCTRLPITTPIRFLAIAATILIEAMNDESNTKKEFERLSWFCLDDFEKYK